MRFLLLSLTFIWVVGLWGCGTSAVELSFITHNHPVLRARDATLRLEVKAKNRDGAEVDDADLFWTSSAPNVATVERGVVKAVGPGASTITVRAGQLEASTRVTVFLPVSLEIRPDRLDLYGEGRSTSVRAVMRDAQGKRLEADPRWRTSDARIATVEGGRVSSLKAGTTLLTAIVGDLSSSIEVRVYPAPVGRIDIGATRVTLARGKQFRLQAKAYDSAGRPLLGVPVFWHSSDERVVKVENGLLIAESEGTTVVSAIVGSRKAGAVVEVQGTPPPAPPTPGSAPTGTLSF